MLVIARTQVAFSVKNFQNRKAPYYFLLLHFALNFFSNFLYNNMYEIFTLMIIFTYDFVHIVTVISQLTPFLI